MRNHVLLGGRYRVEGALGSGGMSVVYRAHDVVLDRGVAVKVVSGPGATDPVARRRILDEAKAAAKLSHPHVTNVYDYGESTDPGGDCLPYVVMEMLTGTTLAQRLAAGPMPHRTALRVCAQVADAITAAHARNLVHRDIKPSNVMLTPSGAKVLDFGIAAIAGQPETDPDGHLMGTPAYLAPERLTAAQVVPASDVYALGLLVYRSLTNRLPWRTETTTQMLRAHTYVEPSPLPPMDNVPAEVDDLVRRCLAKQPVDRPPAAEVARVLAVAAGMATSPENDPDEGPAAGSPPRPGGRPTTLPETRRPVATSQRRRLLRVAAVAGTTFAVAALGAVLADRDREPSAIPQPSTAPGGSASASGPAAGSSAPAGPSAADPTPRPTAPAATTTPRPTTAAGATATARSTAPARSTAAAPGTPITAFGGVVTVLCRGDDAQVTDLVVKPGYQIKDHDPGPDGEIQVVLLSTSNESEIKATCSDGTPVPRIKESPQ
ncbi:serine/threonine-protein kinase [Plantactinospora sp. GCM10030261]|uniref:serine/threonine-protein kinase n=1 Tax=Plantactinospora sp. GCM10030261 TaxID=3273420 RepID=UPI0036062EA6